jgi:hypothetical protein
MNMTSRTARLLIPALLGVWLGLWGANGCGQKTPDEQAGQDHGECSQKAKIVPKLSGVVLDSLRVKKKRYGITRDAYWDDKGGVLENSYLEVWYPPGPTTVTHGMHAFEQLEIARFKCRDFFRFDPGWKLKVICAPDMEAYKKETGRDWWNYSKIEKDQITFQPIYILFQRHLDEIAIRHEYFVWAIGRLTEGRAPHWLVHGLASYLSDESDLLANQLNEFHGEKLAMTVEEIEKNLAREKDRKLTRIADYHAYKMVETLIVKLGEETLSDLVLRLREDLDMKQACLLVFKEPVEQVMAIARDYEMPSQP